MGPAMATSPRSNFAHRNNHDGTFDSIRKQCFQAVACERQEFDLRKLEDAHICQGLKLGDVLRPFDRK